MDQRAVFGYGPVSAAWNRALPGASRINKIIVKPCAGKSHARFDEGTEETWIMVMIALQRASVLLYPFSGQSR